MASETKRLSISVTPEKQEKLDKAYSSQKHRVALKARGSKNGIQECDRENTSFKQKTGKKYQEIG